LSFTLGAVGSLAGNALLPLLLLTLDGFSTQALQLCLLGFVLAALRQGLAQRKQDRILGARYLGFELFPLRADFHGLGISNQRLDLFRWNLRSLGGKTSKPLNALVVSLDA